MGEVNGSCHHATLSILSNYAETIRLDGDNSLAEDMFRKAYYNEMQRAGGNGSITLSMFANNLAVVLRDQDRNEEARYWYERAVAGLTKFYGPDHDKVHLVTKNLKELTSDPNPV